jgi:hypothetical protein
MIGEHHSIRLDPREKKGFPILGLLKLVATMPVIYALILPIAFLDLMVSVYQRICFPVYGIPLVKRGSFVRIRRKGLESLNIVDRLNCHYCAYCNGILRYAQKIASETEKMWCPIRHKLGKGFIEPAYHRDFAENGRKEVLLQYYGRYERGLKSGDGGGEESADAAACPAESSGASE